ncbi:hypothetical protein RF11_01333 [Thelohanellus kitauei]|uniref:CCHC-type domain-containing protein n=1 Tax=Thelohanellus kitauei TaxID=669202 RepID=A0A0C2JKW0_THEKT|nr:hypothetical protein RF11_01333 [Thelohanellus kitauei]
MIHSERNRERTEESVFAVREKSTKKGEGSHNKESKRLDPSISCLRCGGEKHTNTYSCPALKAECFKCKKIGHYGRVCIRSGTVIEKKGRNKINYMTKDSSDSQYIVVHSNRVDKVLGSIAVVPGYKIVVHINGHPVTMTIDSGASVSCIGPSVWRQIGKPAMTHVGPLKGYSNNRIKTLGFSTVRVRIDSGEFNLIVIVITIEDQLILGLNWFEALGISVGVKWLDTLRAEPETHTSELLSSFSRGIPD